MMPTTPGRVAPTRAPTVAATLIGGGAAGWSAFTVLDAFGAALPRMPVEVTYVIAILAVLVGVQAVIAHRAIQVRRTPIAPQRALALLVLGKACLLTGAALAGGYAAVAAYNWSRLDAALPRERVVSSVTAVVASVGLAVAGAFLERACRIPRPGKDDDATPPTIPGTSDTPD